MEVKQHMDRKTLFNTLTRSRRVIKNQIQQQISIDRNQCLVAGADKWEGLIMTEEKATYDGTFLEHVCTDALMEFAFIMVDAIKSEVESSKCSVHRQAGQRNQTGLNWSFQFLAEAMDELAYRLDSGEV